MAEERYIDVIEYAWQRCNPGLAFPEMLRDSWRGAPVREPAGSTAESEQR